MLPNDWKMTRLNDVLSRESRPINVNTDSTYQQIGIRSHCKGIFHKPPVSGAIIGEKRVFEVVPNALVLNIVFAWEQAVAVTSSSEIGMIASHRFPMYWPRNNRCDINFLKYFFSTSKGKYLLELSSPGGAGRNKTLGQKEFEQLCIPMPKNCAEQKRIADILSTWDKAILASVNLLNVKNKEKKSVINLILTGQKRLPGFTEKWKHITLDKVCTFYKGGGLSRNDLCAEGSNPCILYGELFTTYDELIDSVKSRTNLECGYLAMSGDVLMPTATTTEAVDLAKASALLLDGVLIGGDAIIIRSDKSKILSEYLAYVLTYSKKREIAARAQGATIVHLSVSDIKDLDILVPSIAEQRAITNVLRTLTLEEKAISEDIKALKQEKFALMQQLLTGKRCVRLSKQTVSALT